MKYTLIKENIKLVAYCVAGIYNGSDIHTHSKCSTRTCVSCKKCLGMKLLIRSMGIDFVATDEIGSKEDVEAIKEALSSGVKLLVTSHGSDIEDLEKELYELKVFKNVVILAKDNKPGFIKNIYKLKGENYVSIY